MCSPQRQSALVQLTRLLDSYNLLPIFLRSAEQRSAPTNGAASIKDKNIQEPDDLACFEVNSLVPDRLI